MDDNESSEIFDELINALLKKKIKFINFEEAVTRIKSKQIVSECLIAFTFDDGFEECFTKIKPVLDKYGIKASFFINPNFVEGDGLYRKWFTEKQVLVNKNPMTWDQIKTLSDEGHTIGAHTLDHLDLNSNDREMLYYQIKESKDVIEKKLGIPCNHFAFPFGRLENISAIGVDISRQYFDFVYSQSNYRYYFSFNGQVINRRHFEANWPLKHVIYFLKSKRY
ncbi:MAG: polysaccharide deacetylase family protein [Bacteroidales bacterium]